MTRPFFEFKIDLSVAKDPSGAKKKRVKQAADTGALVRLPGVSLIGPCERCIPYFYVEHDGSGRTVPTIPLHRRCVCRDVPAAAYVALDGENQEPMQKWAWVKSTPDGQRTFERAVGKTRAELMRAGAITPEDLLERGGLTPKKIPLEDLARRISRSPARRAALDQLAADLGVTSNARASTFKKLMAIMVELRG